MTPPDQQTDATGFGPISESIFYTVLLVWLVCLLYWSRDWTDSQDWLFPSVTILLCIFLILVQLARFTLPKVVSHFTTAEGGSFKAGSLTGTTQPRDDFDGHEAGLSARAILFWVIILPVLLYYTGFLAATLVFIFGYVYYATNNRTKAAFVSAFTTLFTYILFIYVLGASLWGGVLF